MRHRLHQEDSVLLNSFVSIYILLSANVETTAICYVLTCQSDNDMANDNDRPESLQTFLAKLSLQTTMRGGKLSLFSLTSYCLL